MYRSHNCGELRINDLNKEVKLSGWVQKVRDKGFIMWVDLRDRYGVTQLIFDQERTPSDVIDLAKTLGREFVINITGSVIERNSKNDIMSTGDIEVLVSELKILNSSITPPFTIEDESDGGEELSRPAPQCRTYFHRNRLIAAFARRAAIRSISRDFCA